MQFLVKQKVIITYIFILGCKKKKANDGNLTSSGVSMSRIDLIDHTCSRDTLSRLLNQQHVFGWLDLYTLFEIDINDGKCE